MERPGRPGHGREGRGNQIPVLNCTVTSRDSSTPLRFARNDHLCGRAEAAVLMKESQYFGTVGTMESDHASIPPSRLYTLAKPCCFSNRTASALRRPL